MNRFRLLSLFALGLLLHATTARAQSQYELKAGNFNAISQGALPVGGNQATQPQTPANSNFRAVGAVTGSSGAISPGVYPADTAPSRAVTVVLTRSTIGGGFASGVPRYSLGEVITPPLVQADGVTTAEEGYWRARPLAPGELVAPFYSAAGGLVPGGITPIPTVTVNVTNSNTSSTLVEVASVPPEVVVGSTLLGQPITAVNGLNITLAGPANQVISTSTPRPVYPALTYYYSPHAEKVYASQPGRVNVIWVSLAATANGGYETLSETFAVSSNTSLPVRTIFWTEGSFDGPVVRITDTRITTVNPAYYSTVPKAVAQEVSIPGYTPLAPNLKTLSFAKFSGTGQLNAYNVEGRIFVEYLGNVRQAPSVYDQIGFDIVELVRVPVSRTKTVHLGQELTPHDGSTGLTPSPVLSLQQEGSSYYGTSVRPDGSSAFYAERVTSPANDPDNGVPSSIDAYNKVVFYWLETGSFSIQWPKFQNRYWQRWSPNLDDYVHYTVDPNGSTAATGISFAGGNLPQIVHQDDPAQAEAKIDINTQHLTVDLSTSTDQYNRSLLKFTSSSSIWYVNLYTQAENRVKELVSTSTSTVTTTVTVPSTAGLSVGMTVTGPGITGSATILSILNGTQLILSQNIADGTNNLIYADVEDFDMATSMTIVPGSTNPFFLSGGTWRVNGSATTATAVIESPELLVTAAGPVTLDMVHSYNFEYTFDGGRLLVSRNGGAYSLVNVNGQDHMQSAGGGGVAWTGVQSNVTSNAVLFTDGMVGDTYRFRLQATWDSSQANQSPNWNIGAITLNNGSALAGSSVTLSTTSQTLYSPSIITVSQTVGLEVGMIVTGPGISGSATITRIINGTTLEISQIIPNAMNNLSFTVQSDAAAPINAAAIVGTRLLPPAGHENAGYISSGTGYYPAGYLNPFEVGATAANAGAIIPVNARPADNQLTVRWFKKIAAPSAAFNDLYVPGKIGRYTVSYPASTTPQIVIAQGIGTGDLTGAKAAGSVYYQNNPALPGYNPNEEHALPLGGRVYALREDLNVTSGAGYTSEPFVLVAYTDPTDNRPAMHAYKVVREDATYAFDYTATAGTLLVKPYPLPLMPLAMVGTGANRTAKDLEIISVPDVPNNTTVVNDPAYERFTFKDRKGFTWVHRGPHDGGTPELQMKLYYLSRAGFFVPGTGEVPVNTIMPFLRPAARSGQTQSLTAIDAGQADEPLSIVYRPEWPSNAPELRVAETLTLPKFGLPQVRGQASAQVIYQQSIAQAAPATGLTKNSVTLHDPTREKIIALDAAGVGLDKLPSAIKTTSYQGKTYFQGLPAHLQQRLFLDPLRGNKGTLVLIGEFHDEIAGEDYLDLNLLTAAEELAIKSLVPTGADGESEWHNAIDALNTRVETFKPDPAQFGSYIVDSSLNADVGENDLAVIRSPETAVDSYAVTATGQGTGFVTMVFGNGRAFTPEGDPVVVQVFRIADQLYVGDLKVVTSSNPLDEQVTLRHSGDFAGKPELYDFEWRWATGEASAPATYASVMTTRIGDPLATPNPTDKWIVVSDPGALKPSAAQYTAAGAAVILGARNVHPVNYVLDAQNQPTSTVIEETSYTAAEIAAGYPSLVAKSEHGVNFTGGVPGRIVFSAGLGTRDGIVLYVNDKVALAFNAPTPQFTLTNAGSGLTNAGKSSAGGNASLKQFDIAPSYFRAGANKIEIAIYTAADPNAVSSLQVLLEAAQETDLVTTGTTWQTASDPEGKNTNLALVGGSPGNPFGGPQFVLNDRWFTMRYKTKAGTGNVLGDNVYSRWMPPQFVEGWIKRVLAAINPFEQRVKDLYNNVVNTDVSVLTQAGTRWEGDIALNLDSINDAGLIAIYETVLNRAKSMSIDANTDDPDSNNALILAAGYLSDLYTLLGNEAYADAANPTISLDDQTTVTEVNTSRFAFESQVASSLEEELALLRGRDNAVSPGVMTAPAYNRLYWNYTRGINSGEVIYAINYNIKEKVGSSTADGVIDESDAQRMFPQGHGDAYGHYLTALTGYYRLLTNANFTWKARAEVVTVLGQPVTVDFLDERKFAAAAGNVARTAEQIVALTHRKQYQDDPSAGWRHFRDDDDERNWGLDEWTSRATQGALFHWAVGNALVPDVDRVHSGVQKIDRTTVPELSQLAAAADTFQTTIDNASAHLNPLGLTSGSIALDLDPSFLTTGSAMQGKGHYEQIYERALRAMLNTEGSFKQAATMTRALRNQQNLIDEYNTTIAEQETAYKNQLIDIFGRPYSGEIGPGKLYAQGYTGPDLEHWFIVDRPNGLNPTDQTITITVDVPPQGKHFTGGTIDEILATLTDDRGQPLPGTQQTVTVQPSQFVQYNDVWKPGGLGSRPETGELQIALQEAQRSYLELSKASGDYANAGYAFHRAVTVFKDLVQAQKNVQTTVKDYHRQILALEKKVNDLEISATFFETVADTAAAVGDATAEYFPKVLGLANDATSPARGTALTVAITAFTIAKSYSLGFRIASMAEANKVIAREQSLEQETMRLEFSHEAVQAAYEIDLLYREHIGNGDPLMLLTLAHQQALQNVKNVLSKGQRILAEREVFRQRAAAVIQGYRTKDIGFRLFRNEALEQYRSLFDLASRYAYLAAKSYDYETGLLGTPQGRRVFDRLVAARSLGDLTGGTPQSTTSTLGDAGLAGVLAQLQADFSVAKGRLGINNPDRYGTVFSLRSELFRLLDDPTVTNDDQAWQQTLEQHIHADLMADPDVVAFCRNIRKPDGTPVPGLIIPFSSTIQHTKNFFGLNIAAGDHAFTPSNFATKIHSVGIVLPGYVGMDAYAAGNMNSGTPARNDPNALSATPYVYFIPCGSDSMLAPPLGDTNTVRTWKVQDQALPLPYNLGANDFNSTQFFNANGTLSERPWIIRKHQAFRPVSDPSFFYSSVPQEFTNTRLIGRSVWNSQWKIVIPAYPMLNDENEALNRFAASVKDIQLFLRTYSHSGN